MNTNHISLKIEHGIGQIILNRMDSLNALTLDMIRVISQTLQKWQSDQAVDCVLFLSEHDQAFCAGGDIKQFYNIGMDYRRGYVSEETALLYFKEEYELNCQIATYEKPTLSYVDGICMGGGYGIAGHCDVRIIGANASFAMPEVKIGFFPDVGSIYHLTKTPNAFGTYLALTGQSILPQDMILSGLFDVFSILAIEDIILLIRDVTKDIEILKSVLQTLHDDKACAQTGQSIYQKHKTIIKIAFDGFRLPRMIKALSDNNDDFSKQTLQKLQSASPTSVLVTAEYTRRVEGASVEEVLEQDLILTKHFINHNDLYEGIRAQLIDKDKLPQWDTDEMKTIPSDVIDSYFAS